MSGITGQATTYNLPNYVGELFSVTPQDTPLLSAIGGLTGGKESNGSTAFTWQYYDLRDADKSRQRLEGANAPTAEQRVRSNDRNVLEIHQEQVEVSYTKQAAANQVAAVGSSHPQIGGVPGSNPVQDEVDWQVRQQLVQKARDVEVTFISGTFQDPADNTTPRKTRGLVQAITSGASSKNNRINGFDTPLTKTLVLDAMQRAYDNGGLMEDETRTLMLGSTQKRALTAAFINSTDGYRFSTRNVGGVNVQTIETDFGTVNVVLNRHVPSDTVLILSLEQIAPVFLNVPNKGHFFVEPLSKAGSSDRFQLYGEIGLEYGNPLAHALIDNLGGYSS